MMYFLNAIDFLLKDISLSEVRSRTIPNSPLDISNWLYKNEVNPERIAKVEPRLKQIVKGVNLLLPSLLLVLFGIRRIFKIRKNKQMIKSRFQLIQAEPVIHPSQEEEKPL